MTAVRRACGGVRRLEERGVILGYSARIDPAAVGRQFVVNVDFELAGQGKGLLQEFEQALASYDEVVQCRRMFGRPDYQALVAVADLETYERFMTEELMALPNLGRLESRLVMEDGEVGPHRLNPDAGASRADRVVSAAHDSETGACLGGR
jgi:DNA-binding Lrp family transcriptional regulator